MSAEICMRSFDGAEIRIYGTPENPLFVAADICNALEIRNNRDALESLDDDEKGVALTDTLGGEQKMLCVTESGLYHLIFKSRKAAAKKFRRWVTMEVLPEIRKTGSYQSTDDFNLRLNSVHSAMMRMIKGLIEVGVHPDKASACVSNTFKESLSRGTNTLS